MRKWKIILFYIVTFGIGYFILKNKAKKMSKVENQELDISYDIPFDIERFLEEAGGKENIIKTEATISSLNIFYNKKIKELSINYDFINSLKPKGIMKYENKISILFGDFSKILSNEINKRL